MQKFRKSNSLLAGTALLGAVALSGTTAIGGTLNMTVAAVVTEDPISTKLIHEERLSFITRSS